MVKAPYDVSLPSNPNYAKFSHLLSPGWLGRPVDNSDSQYSNFRDIFPILVALVLAHQLLRRWLFVGASPITFDAIFGCIVICALHGLGAVKIIAILSINYWLPRNVWAYWGFGVGILFANELLDGYPLGWISPQLEFLDKIGPMHRWQVFFKFTMIRMLSFSLDRMQALESHEHHDNKKPVDSDNEKARITTPLDPSHYNFIAYIAYCLYSPLYVAGPIISFNDYFRQRASPLKSLTSKNTLRYAIRFTICLLTMEIMIHYCYVVAITSTRAWDGNTPAQISMLALFNLAHIWLKLLIPWRFFRLWALIDGVDGPENMIRCVANNYSALLFWRSWHRSFNRWVVRYLYVPIGGNSRPLLNSAVVFTFVALWHDINPRLLIWSWLIILFVMPEMAASKLFPAKKFAHRWWYRHLCAVGAVLNIWMMMIANLVGFAVGLDGIKDMLFDMTHTAQGLWYSIFASCMLFVGAQMMFEVREREHRAGIDLKC